MPLKYLLLSTLCISSLCFSAYSTATNEIDWGNTSTPITKNPYLDIPDIGGGVGLISRQQEQQIGEKVLREVRRALPEINDAWLEDELKRIFSSIYSQTNLGKPVALVIIRDPQINAFAVPGGLFAVNAGTILAAKNLDELSGVVAHEIAHVTQRHYSRSREALQGQNLLTWAGMLAGIIIASQSPDAGAAVMMGSQAAMLDQQLAYSRDQEREADRVGMQYMAIAGYAPESMADFFELMHRSTSQLTYLPDFWLTHPLTTERMSEARLRARQYHVQMDNSPEKQQRFELIRWRTLVLTGFSNLPQLTALAPKNPAAALALATYYTQQSKYSEAKALLDQIKPTPVQKNLYYLTLSEWYLAQGQYQQALSTILPLYQIAPENYAFRLHVAKIYLGQKQGDAAHKVLSNLSLDYPQNVQIWQLLQQAEALRNTPVQAINALRYRAEAQYWGGYEEDGIKSLLHAQRLAKDHPSLQAKIDARLQEMQDSRELKL